jgi:hypothetical protein
VFNAGAVMFHGVTDDPLSRAAAVLGDPGTADRLRAQALATYERLGAQWWLRRLGAGPASSSRMVLRPIDGGVWLVGPEPTAVPVRALRGFGYLRELVRHPGREISVLDLAGGGTPVVDEPGLGKALDKRALAAYRERLRQLDGEIAAADWSDIGRLDAARAEREALIDELARATGLGGRARTAAGSSRERARIATRKAVSAAVDRIAAVDEPLADHLRRSIRTGLSCSYEPGRGTGVEWVLD